MKKFLVAAAVIICSLSVSVKAEVLKGKAVDEISTSAPRNEISISYANNNSSIYITIKQDENGIRFEAKNESPYINPETMNNLFKKYVSHAAKFNKIGVGLGLYLSKQIIDAHNGEIYGESFKDNHNTFGFIIPMISEAAVKEY